VVYGHFGGYQPILPGGKSRPSRGDRCGSDELCLAFFPYIFLVERRGDNVSHLVDWKTLPPRIGGIKGGDMGSKFLRLQSCCFFLLLSLVVSCSLNLGLKKPEGEKEFIQETSRLEKLAREAPATSVRAKSQLQLAFLYVNSRNPQLNYFRALQEMESYLSMSPAKAQKDDFRNWLVVLRKVDHLNNYGIELGQTNQNLQVQIDKLQAGLKK
jgi:hypothetical protein